MEQTIFEKIINRDIPAHIVYEDEDTIAILDVKPKTLGHTLVIPKRVSRTLLEMDPSTLGQYFAVVQKVAQAIKKGLAADGFNIVINIEKAGWQEVFHTHTHIIPRKTADGVTLTPGDTKVTYSSPDQMSEYVEKIKAHLS
jgi:histidine triad (HIT) family protein